MKKTLLISIICLLVTSLSYSQNYLYLKDKTIIEGKVKYVSDSIIEFEHIKNNQVVLIPKSLIAAYYDKFDLIKLDPAFAQINYPTMPIYKNSAGDDLISCSKRIFAGILLTGAGVTIAGLAPQMSQDLETQKNLIYVGSGLVIVGTIVEFTAIKLIGNAGRKLNLEFGKDGFGFKYKF